MPSKGVSNRESWMFNSHEIYFLSFERSELDSKCALIVCVCASCYVGMCACRPWNISCIQLPIIYGMLMSVCCIAVIVCRIWVILDLSAWRELVVTLSNSGKYTKSYLPATSCMWIQVCQMLYCVV